MQQCLPVEADVAGHEAQDAVKTKIRLSVLAEQEPYLIYLVTQHDIKVNELRNYSVYFLKMTHALCPPKPKVLDNATFTSRSCALLNVKFRL